MDALKYTGTEDTPNITLDKGNGTFEISGRSLPEDAAHYYNPVIEWLDNYAKAPNETTSFVVKLEYFNTASSKMILDVLMKLEEIKNTNVKWYYDKEDEDMQEAGTEFSELISVPFEIITL